MIFVEQSSLTWDCCQSESHKTLKLCIKTQSYDSCAVCCISVPWSWVLDHPDTVCNFLMNSQCVGYQVQVSLESVCFCWLPFCWWQLQSLAIGWQYAVMLCSVCPSVPLVLAQNSCIMAIHDFRTVQWMVYGRIFPAMCAVLYYKRLEQIDLHSWRSCWLQWFHLCVTSYGLIMIEYFALFCFCRWQLL